MTRPAPTVVRGIGLQKWHRVATAEPGNFGRRITTACGIDFRYDWIDGAPRGAGVTCQRCKA